MQLIGNMMTFCFQMQFSPCDHQKAREQAKDQVLRAINEGIGETAHKPETHEGDDFINFTAAIERPLEFWGFVKPKLPVHSVKLTVVAEGEQGWDVYLLLYHFDPDQILDNLPSGVTDGRTP